MTRNLWDHKRRAIGALVAVCLGVAFLTGTLMLSDTLRTNFSNLFDQANGGTSVVVRGATKIGTDTRLNTRVGVPADLVSTVRSQPGVADAEPYVRGFGKLLGSDGKSFVRPGPPTTAANWISNPSLNPYKLVNGRAPSASGEVIINRGAAKQGHLRLGDTTTVLVPQPVRVKIVGIATFGTADGFGPSTFTAFTYTDALRYLTTTPDQVNEIEVQAAPDTSPSQLAGTLRGVLPPTAQTITGSQLSQENYNQVNKEFLGFLRNALLIFASVALLVGAFSIHNNFSIVAAQRSRESALMRALGASRRQVLGAAVGESGVIGVTGAVLGVLGGVGFAGLLKGLFSSFGFALPAGGLTVRGSSLLLALLVGAIVTLLAGAAPAVRASRVKPLAAVRDAETASEGTGRVRRWAGAITMAAGVLAAVGSGTIGHRSGNVMFAAAGAVLVLAGIVLLGPVVARPAVQAIGRPVEAGRGLTGTLARENAARQPRRTAGTAAALLLGVSVVALFTVIAGSLKASVGHAVKQTVAGDLVVGGSGFGGIELSPQLARDVNRLPQVGQATGLGENAARINGTIRTLTLADPTQLPGVIDLRPVAGSRSVAELQPDQLAASRTFAKAHHLRVGSTVSALWPDGTGAPMTIGAIYQPSALVQDLIVPAATYTAHDPQALDNIIYIKVRPGADLAATESAVNRLAYPYGQPKVQTRAQYETSAASSVNTILGLIYVMLALSIVIALLGIANTLSLSIHERRRELGLLRAVGQTRRQTRSMVRWESVIVAVFGTIGGLATGVLLGWALVRTAAGTSLSVFAAPAGQLVIILIAGALAGVLAAVRPARRAARLELLTAIAAE